VSPERSWWLEGVGGGAKMREATVEAWRTSATQPRRVTSLVGLLRVSDQVIGRRREDTRRRWPASVRSDYGLDLSLGGRAAAPSDWSEHPRMDH
jgi:hypothetical protein